MMKARRRAARHERMLMEKTDLKWEDLPKNWTQPKERTLRPGWLEEKEAARLSRKRAGSQPDRGGSGSNWHDASAQWGHHGRGDGSAAPAHPAYPPRWQGDGGAAPAQPAYPPQPKAGAGPAAPAQQPAPMPKPKPSPPAPPGWKPREPTAPVNPPMPTAPVTPPKEATMTTPKVPRQPPYPPPPSRLPEDSWGSWTADGKQR